MLLEATVQPSLAKPSASLVDSAAGCSNSEPVEASAAQSIFSGVAGPGSSSEIEAVQRPLENCTSLEKPLVDCWLAEGYSSTQAVPSADCGSAEPGLRL